MKKIISILLVAMLIIGMFPATALTASAEGTWTKATSIAVGDVVTLVYETAKKELGGISTTSTKYGTGVDYASAPAGKYPLTVVAGKTAGSFAFQNEAGSYLYWTSGNSLNVSATLDNKTSWTVSFDGNGNATITNVATTTRVIKWNASSPRFACYTSGQQAIQLYKLSTGGSTEPECEHTNTTAIGEAADPTCTETGITAGEKCVDCGETVTEQETIPALGHNYVDGVCSVCGAEEPDGYVLTDIAAIKEGDIVIITMAKDGTVYAMSNNNGTSSAPSAVKVTVSNGIITDAADNILWNVGGSANAYEFYPNGETAKWLYCTSTNNGVRVGTNTAKTFKIDATSGYLVHNGTSRYIGVYNAQDWRCYTSVNTNITGQTLAFYVQSAGSSEECTHANTEPIPAVDATCTSTGLTEGIKCADCPYIITEQTETPALGHNMVEGICSRCGLYEEQAEVMTAAPGNGDKIIIHHISSNSALALAAKSDDLAGISTTPVEGKLPYYTSVAVLTVGQVGDTYTFTNADGKYLSTAGSNQLSFVAVADANSYWTIALTDEKFIITNAGTSTLALEYYNGAFTTYTAGTGDYFQMALYLVEKGEEACQHPTTEPIAAVEATCTSTGLTEGAKCTVCGVTTVPQTDVPMLPHNYENDVCTDCGAKMPTRYYIAAYRNSESKYYYMTCDLGDNSTKRYQAVATDILPSNIDPDQVVSAQVFILTDNGDGTCILQAEGVADNNYLGWTSGNSGTLVAKEDAKLLTLSDSTKVEGAYNIHFTGDAERYLSLNEAKDANYFAWYKGTQLQDLILIPVEEAETTTATLYGDVDGITVDGSLELNLNGKTATNVSAAEIRAYDSTATATAEGTGTLTVTEGTKVVIDNTVGSKRYIALNNEGVYSFHVLEMKLSAVTLRTTAAGFYYKATVVCDETLLGAINSYGVVLSTWNMPGADFEAENNDTTTKEVNGWTAIEGAPVRGEEFTSGSVFNIFKDGADNAARGEVEIYANAYIVVDGITIMADKDEGQDKDTAGFDGIAWSMKDVMEALNASTTLTNEQMGRIYDFYDNWKDAMENWEVDTIANDWAQYSTAANA